MMIITNVIILMLISLRKSSLNIPATTYFNDMTSLFVFLFYAQQETVTTVRYLTVGNNIKVSCKK